MARDIENRDDLTALLQAFYASATTDEHIGQFFAELDLATHLPVIVDFWDKLLFGRPVYFGNPLAVHQHINERLPLRQEHFARWVEIFSHAVDAHFAGARADEAKRRAATIAGNLHERLQAGPVAGVQIASR
jgi:hemoglobin